MARSSQSVTLEQIAKRAEVSPMTVSNVLAGHHKGQRIDARKRAERIRRIAREMGYRPNAAARAVRQGSFGAIAMLLSTHQPHSLLPAGLVHGVQAALAEHNHQRLELAQLPDETLTSEQQMAKLLRELSVDGLLIDYTSHIPPSMIEIIHEYHLPAIWLNSKQPIDCVRPDDFEAAHRATRHLLELGHEDIGYLDFWHGQEHPPSHYSAVDRQAGYERAMAEAGLPCRVLRPPRTVPSRGWADAACQVLRGPERPTAILAYSCRQGAAVYCACLRLGLSVPEDLSIITFGETPITHVGLTLSTMVLPHEAEGRQAVGMVLQKIADPHTELPALSLTFGFEAGESIAPPGQGRDTSGH